jgi:hypothetical protein
VVKEIRHSRLIGWRLTHELASTMLDRRQSMLRKWPPFYGLHRRPIIAERNEHTADHIGRQVPAHYPGR